MRHCIACLALAGCSFSLAPITGDTGSDDGIIDAPAGDGSMIDAPADAPVVDANPLCFGAAPYTICVASTPIGTVAPPPTTALSLSYLTSTCNSGEVITPTNGGPELCVHDYTDVALNSLSRITATGTRPLVILSTGDIRIDGTVEITGDQAAGGAFAGCSTAINGGNDPVGGGGGAGGSSGAIGGNGGDVTAGGAGGNGAAIATPTFLRGGCPGGAGGTSSSATGGAGGRGGGGIYLLAAGRLIINGKITASGEGGSRGANGRSGGGGGGSGGMIVLYGGTGIMVAPTAEIWANGGGGAGGSDFGNLGSSGFLSPAPLTAGNGGSGGASGATSGAAGGTVVQGAGNAPNGDKSGGGGGGGVGWIENVTGGAIVPGVFSPPAS